MTKKQINSNAEKEITALQWGGKVSRHYTQYLCAPVLKAKHSEKWPYKET